MDEAEKSLKKALELNPVSTKTILELCDIYKMRAPTFNKFYFYNMDALKYAYSGFELARIYKNLGFYYYEENNTISTRYAVLLAIDRGENCRRLSSAIGNKEET